MEEEIGKVQTEKTRLETEMGNPAIYSNKEEYSKIELLYKLSNKRLTELNSDYEELFEKVMQMEEKN